MTRGSKTPEQGEDKKVTEDREREIETASDDPRDAAMERIEAIARRLDQREADLDSREASLAPREREHEQAVRSRALDDSSRQERLSLDFYAPPNQLEVPEDGEYHYRWVAEWVNGNQTPRSVQERLREGYERVMAESLPEGFLVDEDSFGDGYARTTGLILMRVPHQKKRARDNYYRKISRQRLSAANDLQGIAGRDAVSEDRGTRSLTGAEAGQALQRMRTS